MSRGKKYQKKPYESDMSTSDTSANIYISMLLSDAWRDLSAQQQRLYIYCKAQLYAEKTKPNNDPLSFTMNQSKWSCLYRLYDRSNAKGFYRDMSALIAHGFIVCVESGAKNHIKSIYRYSDMWQKWGTADFAVDLNDMTAGMRRRLRGNK